MLLPGLALAQAADDWEVTRSGFDPRLAQSYETALERNPDDVRSARALYDLYRKYRTTKQLIDRYRARTSPASRCVLADLLGRSGDVAGAVAVLEAFAPGHAQVDARLAALYTAQQRPADADAALDRAASETDDPARKRRLLEQLARTRDAVRSKDALIRLCQVTPGDIHLRMRLVDALEQAGAPRKEQLAELERAERLAAEQHDAAQRVEVLSRLGDVALADDAPDRAQAAYERALALASPAHPLRHQLLEGLVAVYRKRDELRSLTTRLERELGKRGRFEWELLARLRDETGDLEGASQAFRRALEIEPHAVDLRARYIALLDRLGREGDALREQERLAAAQPTEPRHQLALAERQLRIGDGERTFALLERIAHRFPRDAGVFAALSDLYERVGRKDRALACAERVVAIDATDESGIVQLGEQHFQRGDKKKAIEVWRRLLTARRPKNAAVARLGELLVEHDLVTPALELLTHTLAQMPRDPALRRALAQAFERVGRNEEASSEWERVQALVVDPDVRAQLGADAADRWKREARTRMIGLLARERRLQPRMGPYLLLFRANPPNVEAGLFLAEEESQLGHAEAAEQVLRQVLTAAPDHAEALERLALVLRARRAYSQAIDTLERLAKVSPARARDCYTRIADLALLLYRDDDAIAYARRVADGPGGDAAAELRLAEIFEKRDDVPAAIAAYRKAIERDRREGKAPFALARLLVRNGQLRDAAATYRDLLEHASADETVLDAARRAIDLAEYAGTLGELEQNMRTLEFSRAARPVYRRVLLELYARYAPPLLARAKAGDVTAARSLRSLGEHAQRPLLEALEDADAAGQTLAATMLGALGNPAATPALVRVAAGRPLGEAGHKPALELRLAATIAAGRLGDVRALPTLEALLAGREPALAAAAVLGLGRVPTPRAALLLAAAAARNDEPLGALACAALGEAASGGDYQGQIEGWAADPARPELVRTGCVRALGRLRDVHALPALVAMVEDGAPVLAAAAARALAAMPLGGAEPALAGLVLSTPPGAQRDAALAALCGPASETPRLEPAGSPTTLDIAATLAPAAPAAKVACGPLAPELAAAAEHALARALDGSPDAVLRALTDLDGEGDTVMLGPLGVIAPATPMASALVPRIAVLAGASDPYIRLHAVRLLGKLGEEAIEPALETAVTDGGSSAVGAVAVYIRRHPDRTQPLAGRLSRILAAGAWQARAAAAAALAAEPTLARAAMAGLTAAAGDDNGFVREAVATALGVTGDGRARGGLNRLLADPAGPVREAAARGLHALVP
jgi:tetratricopeptide (TPR) repeat protein